MKAPERPETRPIPPQWPQVAPGGVWTAATHPRRAGGAYTTHTWPTHQGRRPSQPRAESGAVRAPARPSRALDGRDTAPGDPWGRWTAAGAGGRRIVPHIGRYRPSSDHLQPHGAWWSWAAPGACLGIPKRGLGLCGPWTSGSRVPLSSGGRKKPPRSHGLSPQGAIAGTARAQWAGLRSVRCQGPPTRPLGWSKPAKSGLEALPRTPRLHERRQPGALSWVPSRGCCGRLARDHSPSNEHGDPPNRVGPGMGGARIAAAAQGDDPRLPRSTPCVLVVEGNISASALWRCCMCPL